LVSCQFFSAMPLQVPWIHVINSSDAFFFSPTISFTRPHPARPSACANRGVVCNGLNPSFSHHQYTDPHKIHKYETPDWQAVRVAEAYHQPLRLDAGPPRSRRICPCPVPSRLARAPPSAARRSRVQSHSRTRAPATGTQRRHRLPPLRAAAS
jgi:hypothetical protein